MSAGLIGLAGWSNADILVFSGRSPESILIRGVTCSPFSHAAILARVTKRDLELAVADGLRVPLEILTQWQDRLLLFESTTLVDQPCEILGKAIRGVQAHDPEKRILAYDGRVWLMNILSPLNDLETTRLTHYLLGKLGTEYDEGGAVLAGTRLLKWLLWQRADDRSHLFCVETVEAAALYALIDHELPTLCPGNDRPKDMVRKLTKSKVYGKLRRLV